MVALEGTVPTVLSGVAILMFSLPPYLNVGETKKALCGDGENSKLVKSKIEMQQRRLLKIAMSVSICTIMNLVASISLEFQVIEWSETSKDSLDCVLNGQDQKNKATMNKYIDRCDLAEGKVCDGQTPDCSDKTDICEFVPDFAADFLVCSDRQMVIAADRFRKYSCSCPCSFFVKVETPSLYVWALGLLAQSLASSIVGIVLGPTKSNLDLWKVRASASTAVGVKPSDGFVVCI